MNRENLVVRVTFGTIVLVLILVMLLLLIQVAPSITAPSEATAVLLPDGTRAPWFFDTVHGCLPGVWQFGCLDETTQDGNTSYVSDNLTGNPQSGTYTMRNWTGRTDITVTGVRAFMWAKKNQSADPWFHMDLIFSPVPMTVWACGPTFAENMTMAWAYYQTVSYPDRCDGNPGWTVADLNGLVVDLNVVHPADNRIHEAVTMVGVVIEYSFPGPTPMGTYLPWIAFLIIMLFVPVFIVYVSGVKGRA